RPRRLSHRLARFVAEEHAGDGRRSRCGVVRWVEGAADAVRYVALCHTALARDRRNADRHQVTNSISTSVGISDDPSESGILHQTDHVVALAEEADEVQHPEGSGLHTEIFVVGALADDDQPQI